MIELSISDWVFFVVGYLVIAAITKGLFGEWWYWRGSKILIDKTTSIIALFWVITLPLLIVCSFIVLISGLVLYVINPLLPSKWRISC